VNWNNLLFLIFPYLALILALVVTVYRSLVRPFTISSLSSQLLERRQLFWGSISFHYGIIYILLGHLLALIFPKSLVLWNAVPVRLYLLEFTGIAMGVWALVGLLILIWRRVGNARIRAVSSGMDYIVLFLLLVSLTSGVIVATSYRFGSYWFTGIFTPYLWSILTFQPQPALVAPLPWVIKLHVFNFFVLLALFPFSRLVHIITYPLGYLLRPWQIVIWARRQVNAPEP
jgi:nitrate reductase gamma subunit